MSKLGPSFKWSAPAMVEVFLLSAAFIFCVTGVLKLISALGEVKLLAQPDRLVFFLSQRQIIAIAASIELVVGAFVLGRRDHYVRLSAVAFVCLLFLVYRFGLAAIGYNGECKCLGNLTEWLHMPQEVANWLGDLLFGYLFSVSHGLLLFHCLSARTAAQNLPMKS